MKRFIYLILFIGCVLFSNQLNTNAAINVPSSSYNLEVGVEQYLPTPKAYYGYIDNAVWACSSPYIIFKQKSSSGATIKVNRQFSGTAIVEVLAVEKYNDMFGHTRQQTYYKQYLITCKGGGTGGDTEVSEIILPSTITLKMGETKQFKILSGNCYNGAFNLTWEKMSPKNFATYTVNWKTGDISISGVMAGQGVLSVKTVNGEELKCNIKVTSSENSTGRRTESRAISDIRLLTSFFLSKSKEKAVE